MLDRLPEIAIICVIGLLVFGPKRVIEMGGALGKAWREFRESTKDLSWTALLAGNEQPGPQQDYVQLPATTSTTPAAEAEPAPADSLAHAGAAPAPAVVEGSVEPAAQTEKQ